MLFKTPMWSPATIRDSAAEELLESHSFPQHLWQNAVGSPTERPVDWRVVGVASGKVSGKPQWKWNRVVVLSSPVNGTTVRDIRTIRRLEWPTNLGVGKRLVRHRVDCFLVARIRQGHQSIHECGGKRGQKRNAKAPEGLRLKTQATTAHLD